MRKFKPGDLIKVKETQLLNESGKIGIILSDNKQLILQTSCEIFDKLIVDQYLTFIDGEYYIHHTKWLELLWSSETL